jgi:hypothetical protein
MLQDKNWMLRCVWGPAHIGSNAALTAVWIKTPHHTSTFPCDTVTTSAEGDSWICAA